jgi:hypothetical protein
MKVRLDKKLVLRLFCYCREAERSVHRALTNPWPAFRAYYSPAKVRAIKEAVARVTRQLGSSAECPTLPSRDQLAVRPDWAIFARVLFGRWLSRWETAWPFPRAEACYLAGTLTFLLRLLDDCDKPDSKVLIDLRMTLYDCQRIIEGRCYGVPGLKLANDIEHFDQTEWVKHVSLADVLKKGA